MTNGKRPRSYFSAPFFAFFSKSVPAYIYAYAYCIVRFLIGNVYRVNRCVMPRIMVSILRVACLMLGLCEAYAGALRFIRTTYTTAGLGDFDDGGDCGKEACDQPNHLYLYLGLIKSCAALLFGVNGDRQMVLLTTNSAQIHPSIWYCNGP